MSSLTGFTKSIDGLHTERSYSKQHNFRGQMEETD